MVKITIKNLQKKVYVYPKKITRILNKVLKKEKVRGRGEINICFINDTFMRRLNKEYSKKDLPTDVLAFNITNTIDKCRLYADILVSTDTALRNAKIFNTAPTYELSLYCIHGLLHLLGYDDHSLINQKIMRKKELEYVNT